MATTSASTVSPRASSTTRHRALHADGALRVRALPDSRATGRRRWFVRVQCRPDAAGTLAEAIAARDDVSWVSTTSGGSEIVCVAFTDPHTAHGSVLARLPRTSQVLSFTAFAVLHMHVGGTAKWLAFDDPLSPDQLAVLRSGRTGRPDPVGRPDAAIRDDDAPLLAELARDGRIGVVVLARATGWPQSRVSTRLEELLTSGACTSPRTSHRHSSDSTPPPTSGSPSHPASCMPPARRCRCTPRPRSPPPSPERPTCW